MPTPPPINHMAHNDQLRVPSIHRNSLTMEDSTTTNPASKPPAAVMPAHCLNPASDINARLDTQVEVKVYPCNNNSAPGNKKKFTQFNVKPEVRIILWLQLSQAVLFV